MELDELKRHCMLPAQAPEEDGWSGLWHTSSGEQWELQRACVMVKREV
jgi:hypothetical protein